MLRGLAGFFFRPFFQRRFARKFYATFVVDSDALYPNDVANLGDVFGSFHSEICQLGNMHEPVSTWKHFDKRAEFLGRNDTTLVGLADLNFARHATDDLLRACHAFAAGRVDVHRAVVFNVNFSAGLRDNALDGLSAGADQRADLLRIDLDRLDSRRVLGQLRPRFVECAAHDAENLRARFFRALDRFRHDLVADAR